MKYTVTVTCGGRTCNAETENIPVPGTATGDQGQSDPPSQTDTPSQSGQCKWCGGKHSGFFGSIVGFFHAVLNFFAHLFGIR